MTDLNASEHLAGKLGVNYVFVTLELKCVNYLGRDDDEENLEFALEIYKIKNSSNR